MMRIGRYGYLIVCVLVFVGVYGGAQSYQHALSSDEREAQEINSLKTELVSKLNSLDKNASLDSEKARIAYEAHAISLKLASLGYVDTNTLEAAVKAEYYRAKPAKDIAEDLKNFRNIGMSQEMSDNIKELIEQFKKL